VLWSSSDIFNSTDKRLLLRKLQAKYV
jgi:hypothetical protein